MLAVKKKKKMLQESSQAGIFLGSHLQSISHIPPTGLCILSLHLVQPPPFFLQRCAVGVRRATRAFSLLGGKELCARCTAEQALTAKEAAVTEESFAPAHPRLRFRTGKCGSNECPRFPLPHTLPAGSASKSKCKRLNRLVRPDGSCKGRSSGGMLVSPGMPFISAGAVSEASCCLEVVWRVLWGPAHLSSILSTATWIPASALVFCARAKSRALCTSPRMVRK